MCCRRYVAISAGSDACGWASCSLSRGGRHVENMTIIHNEFRKDGTKVDDPVLDSFCKPIPLEPFDDGIAREVMQ